MKKIIDKIQILGIFSITQTVFQIGTVLIMSVSALAGQNIAPSPESASLPISFVILGTLLGLFPASRMMKWKGSKFGLLTGTVIGIFGAILASYAMYESKFYSFFHSTLVIWIPSILYTILTICGNGIGSHT